MGGHRTPKEAVRADSAPAEYVHIVAVEYSPSGAHAIVFIAYNEPPDIEPYVVLCENTPDGWVEGSGGTCGGVTWLSTTDDGSLGVEATWAPLRLRWDVPAPKPPTGQPDDGW
jgi:hypothetical protein